MRFDDKFYTLPWNQLVHATQEDLFACAPPLLMELAIGESQLLVHRLSRVEEDHPYYLRLGDLLAIYLGRMRGLQTFLYYFFYTTDNVL